MTEKPPLGADLLLTLWVLLVAVVFFGPAFVPALGLWTDTASAFYVLLVLAAAVALAIKHLRRHDARPETRTTRRR